MNNKKLLCIYEQLNREEIEVAQETQAKTNTEIKMDSSVYEFLKGLKSTFEPVTISDSPTKTRTIELRGDEGKILRDKNGDELHGIIVTTTTKGMPKIEQIQIIDPHIFDMIQNGESTESVKVRYFTRVNGTIIEEVYSDVTLEGIVKIVNEITAYLKHKKDSFSH